MVAIICYAQKVSVHPNPGERAHFSQVGRERSGKTKHRNATKQGKNTLMVSKNEKMPSKENSILIIIMTYPIDLITMHHKHIKRQMKQKFTFHSCALRIDCTPCGDSITQRTL